MRLLKGLGLLIILASLLVWPLAAEAKTLRIKKVIDVGEKVELDNGAVYSVDDPAEQDVVYHWLPFQEVKLLEGGKTMFNVDYSQKIYVSLVSGPKAPSSGAARGRDPHAGKYRSLSPQEAGMLQKILKRLENMEARLQVMDWRLRRLENETMVRPPTR